MSTTDPGVDFTLSRSFDAPPELVFRTMTQTEHLQKWWGPPGCSIEVLRNDPAPGGVFFYLMRFMPGVEMHGRFDWRALEAPRKLVFVNGFADAEGKRIGHAMSPAWPLEVLNTVTLEAQGGGTRMTLVASPEQASEIEQQTFKAGHASLQQGFGAMYDTYARYLATV